MSDVSRGAGWWQASDGKWYPPEKPPQPIFVHAAPTGGGVWKWVLIVIAALGTAVVGCVALVGVAVDHSVDELESTEQQRERLADDYGIGSRSANFAFPPQADIGEVGCELSDSGRMKATVEVTNHSSKRSTYWVDVNFESPDGSRQIDTSSAYVDNLEPGQSATTEASALAEPPADGFRCRVVEVDRTSS